MDQLDFSIPEGISDYAVAKLIELGQEYHDGDITAKGYRKHRELVLASATGSGNQNLTERTSIDQDSLRNSNYSSSGTPVPSIRQDDRMSMNSQDLSITGVSSNEWAASQSIPDSYSYAESQLQDAENKHRLDDVTIYRSTTIPVQDDADNLGDLNVELQRPLEAREISEAAASESYNSSKQLSKFDNLPSVLRHRGKSTTGASAFIVLDSKGKESHSITWDKLASKSEKISQMIREKTGIYRGDRVVLLYQENEVIEFAVALLGAFVAGAVAVAVSPTSPFRDVENILTNTQAHIVLTTESTLRTMQKQMVVSQDSWPKGVEIWKTNDLGSYHPPKKQELPALQVPDLAYIEFQRSPLGELRGVVMSHRTIIHQMTCITAMLKSQYTHFRKAKGLKFTGTATEKILSNLDTRNTIGLIIGILWTVYTGNTLIWIDKKAMTVPGLCAHLISKMRVTILLSDYQTLKSIAYNYQTFPQLTRNYSKKVTVNFSSLRWCLIDAVTVDTEFHDVLANRWIKPLGQPEAQEVVAPMLTLSEHGGMVVSMRDRLGGEKKMGCKLDYKDKEDPFELSEVLVDKDALASNKIVIVSTSPSRHSFSDEASKSKSHIRVGAFGYPLPDANLAIVNPETSVLCPELQVGEVWIDSPSLSGGFWNLSKETDKIFHAICFDNNGAIDTEFLRSGLLGFIFNGKVYILGLYEDRVRQRADIQKEGTDKAVTTPTIGAYRYYFVSHLVNTIVREVPRVFDASGFDIYVNNEHLPVVLIESTLANTTPSIQTLINPSATNQSSKTPVVSSATSNTTVQRALNEIGERCIKALYDVYQLRVYCVLIMPEKSLPRILRSGSPEIGNMLCKRRFEKGTLPATFVKFGIDTAMRNIPSGLDVDGGIWSPAISLVRTESLGPHAEQQFSGVDFRNVVIDDRTSVPLSDFKSIMHILQWRVTHQKEELAYCTMDNRIKEDKSVSWAKLDQKIASLAKWMLDHENLKAGNAVILMFTHSEEYVIAVHACLLIGVIAIPVAPVDVNRLQEDIPALVNLTKDYGVKKLFVNHQCEAILKIKTVQVSMKQLFAAGKCAMPKIQNTTKVKVNSTATTKTFKVLPDWLTKSFPALVWVYWTADHRFSAVAMSHASILGMCKIQKETCQMSSTKPILGCVRSLSGLGFLHTCFIGVYLGASTLLLSPVDYANNPSTFFLTLSRYKVKDTYSTPQMLDHACKLVKAKGISLAETKNLMVACDGRPRTDLVKRMRVVFAATGLQTTSVNFGYSNVVNPMITTRSYMSLDPIDLWLDPIALRQGLVSVVNPDNFPNALHIHDSGMVPINTQVAIVNPETCRLCKVGEYGEIWVYSEGNANSFFRTKDPFNLERFRGRLADGNADVEYARTGDLGFLHIVTRNDNDKLDIELQTLFVLGSIGETFEVLGLNHFPIDIENSVEKCHPSIKPGGTAIFQAGGFVVMVVEIYKASSGLNLASLVPIIVNTAIQEHQLVLDIVAFVPKESFPRSRLGEKQRGRLLRLWTSKKLPTIGIYGVSQGEKTLSKSLAAYRSTQIDPLQAALAANSMEF